MEMINNLFGLIGLDLSGPMRWPILGVIALVALLILFWLFKKVFGGMSARPARGRQPRLSVTDVAAVDEKRRLILVRRDNVEHLLMIGGPGDIVVETNIGHYTNSEPARDRLARTSQDIPPAPTERAERAEPRIEPVPSRNPEAKPGVVRETDTHVAPAAGAALATAAAVTASDKIDGQASSKMNTTSEAAPVAAGDDATSSSLSGVDEALQAENASDPATLDQTANASLGSEIIEDLENAFGLGESASDGAGTEPAEASGAAPEVRNDPPKKGNTEDEMQKLLDELAAGN
jgi:hypothetical protein